MSILLRVQQPRRVIAIAPVPRLVVQVGIQGPSGADGIDGGAVYQRSFTQSDLSVANALPVTHDLGVYPSSVLIWDEGGEVVIPDTIEYVSANAIAVSLSSFAPIQGQWKVLIGA